MYRFWLVMGVCVTFVTLALCTNLCDRFIDPQMRVFFASHPKLLALTIVVFLLSVGIGAWRGIRQKQKTGEP